MENKALYVPPEYSENEKAIFKLIAETTGVKQNYLGTFGEVKLDELGIDFMDLIEVSMKFEQLFNCGEMEQADVMELITTKHWFDYCDKRHLKLRKDKKSGAD